MSPRLTFFGALAAMFAVASCSVVGPADMAASGRSPGASDALATAQVPPPNAMTHMNTPVLVGGAENPRPAFDGVGAFRTKCHFSHMGADDPIVFPGQPGAAHLHAFFGSTSTNAFSTNESLRAAPSSTCEGGTLNKSAYWAPTLVQPGGAPITPAYLIAYYKTGYSGVANQAVTPAPDGLRILAGSNADGSEVVAGKTRWTCDARAVGGGVSAHTPSIPSCPAGAEVEMAVIMPQCWDGMNLDSADHRSHMAYGTWGPVAGAPGTGCPSSHPVAIPEIVIKVLYIVPAGGTAGLRLSSDMYGTSTPGGLSAHADWMNGWDPVIKQRIVQECLNPGLDCKHNLLGRNQTLGLAPGVPRIW